MPSFDPPLPPTPIPAKRSHRIRPQIRSGADCLFYRDLRGPSYGHPFFQDGGLTSRVRDLISPARIAKTEDSKHGTQVV